MLHVIKTKGQQSFSSWAIFFEPVHDNRVQLKGYSHATRHFPFAPGNTALGSLAGTVYAKITMFYKITNLVKSMS